MVEESSPTGYIAVVRRGEHGVFRAFEEHFGDDPDVAAVVWDRRVADRRGPHRPVAVERRQADRRGAPASSWITFGFVFASRVPAREEPPARGRGGKRAGGEGV